MQWRNLHRLQQAAITSVALAAAPPASAHDWYPEKCCNENDCLPAESFNGSEVTATDTGGTRYTMSVPKAFPVGLSPDGRVHVCFYRPGPDFYRDMGRPGEAMSPILICLFVPPTS